jgi:predicted HAD superfamily Cof-like phosphohydrolase
MEPGQEKTNYQKVIEFNKTFGHPAHTDVQHNVFAKKPNLVKLRLDLIREEVKELEDAVNNNDMTETFDALSDILYVVYGMGAAFGLDLDLGMGLVHDSNMSKICSLEEEARKTVDNYRKLFTDGKSVYDSVTYRPCEAKGHESKFVIFNESTGKILKNINYHPVDFTEMLKKII